MSECVENKDLKSKNFVGVNSFTWVQMFNNSKGKTSGMLLMGFYMCAAGVTTFVFSAFFMLILVLSKSPLSFTNELATLQTQCVAMCALGGTMLGVRRFTNDKILDTHGES
jgi:hypothetical protein